MSDREEYIKLRQVLEDIVTLVNDNHMENIQGLNMLARDAKEALKIANLYEKWRLNVRATQMKKPYQIEYGIGISTYSNIPNGVRDKSNRTVENFLPDRCFYIW